MVLTKSDLYPNETMGMENKTVIVTTILVKFRFSLTTRNSTLHHAK